MSELAGTGAARAAEMDDQVVKFENPLYAWHDRKIRDSGNVTLEIDGAECRILGLTPNGFLKIERVDGTLDSVRLTDAYLDALMPQLAHFKQ